MSSRTPFVYRSRLTNVSKDGGTIQFSTFKHCDDDSSQSMTNSIVFWFKATVWI